MDKNFISLADALLQKKVELPNVKFRSERNALFFELYGYYERSWKRNTWLNYIKWLKQNKFKSSKDKQVEFKKSKFYYPKDSEKTFCSYRLGFMKTNDLYFLISIAKDKENRGENFNQWLFWAIKFKDVV